MIIVDTALRQREREGRPIRVGLVGAGMMGRGIALQLARYATGMCLAAIANRSPQKAVEAYRQAGVEDPKSVETVSQLERAVECGVPAVTEDALLLSQAAGLDVIVEATGTIEHAARVTLEAIAHRKHVILMNAELDGTIGPILKKRADRVKGPCDLHRNPTTQLAFAKKWGLSLAMATSAADGTKLSFENAIVANGTGMRVPIGLAPGCKLKRPIAQDSAITLSDVELPPDLLCDGLWREQGAHFELPCAQSREQTS